MGNINLARVIVGGLVAGLVMTAGGYLLNEVLFAEQGAALMEGLGMTMPGGSQIAVIIAMTFVVGIVLVWLYAAIRPRFGAGISTAIIAGVTGWFLASLVPTIYQIILGLFTVGDMAVPVIFDLIFWVVAAIAGAYVYQEGATTAE